MDRKCKCAGHWRTRRKNWVVLLRNLTSERWPSKYSRVKCLACRRTWRTNASHVATLPDYRERIYGKLTDEDILALIVDARIIVTQRGEVWKQVKRGTRWLELWIRLTKVPDKNSGYLFVDIRHCNNRKWIAVNKLAWMTKHLRVVPEGHQVDHCNRVHLDNSPDNLRLLPSSVNMSRVEVPF